jgi:hypothetical protein
MGTSGIPSITKFSLGTKLFAREGLARDRGMEMKPKEATKDMAVSDWANCISRDSHSKLP